MKEICTFCGMVANIAPSDHMERYGHAPTVWRNGREYQFSLARFRFEPIPGKRV